MKLSKAQTTLLNELKEGTYTLVGSAPTTSAPNSRFILEHPTDRFKNRYARATTVKKLYDLGLLEATPVPSKTPNSPNPSLRVRYWQYTVK